MFKEEEEEKKLSLLENSETMSLVEKLK